MTFAAEPWGRGKSKETWRKTWKAQQQWYFHIFKVELWEMLDLPDRQPQTGGGGKPGKPEKPGNGGKIVLFGLD